MAKMRIYELARELVESGLAKDSKTLNTDIINLLSENGIEGKSHSSGIDDSEADLVRNHYKNKGAKPAKKEAKTETLEWASGRALARRRMKWPSRCAPVAWASATTLTD